MMLTFKAQLGTDTFEASGDTLAFDAPGFINAFEKWINAISDSTKEADAALAALEKQQDELAEAVVRATPEPSST